MKRREFLTTAGLATSGMVMGASSWNRVAGANETMRIGLIGSGSRGVGVARLMQEIPNIELISCCDVIPFRLKDGLKAAAEGATGHDDYRKILDNKDVDAVIIATPYALHADMALDAVDAGKHVYCEKTMVHDVDKARELVEKVENSDKIFQVGHQYHSSRLYSHIAEMVRSGYLGDITAIECQWNRNADWRRPVPDPKWERLINWRMYREFSGGLLAELSSHQVDFTNWALGQHPLRVVGFGGVDYWTDGRETFDNVHVMFEYPDGIKAKFTCLTTNSHGGEYKILVKGKDATVEIGWRNAWLYTEKKPSDKELGMVDGVTGATLKFWQEGKGAPIDVEHEEPTKQAVMDFERSVRDGREPWSNVKTGSLAAVSIAMAIKASRTGQILHWQDEYDFML